MAATDPEALGLAAGLSGLRSLAGRADGMRAVKRATPVAVTFALADGVCATLEGEVRFSSGDAIVHGGHEDVWPVARPTFDLTYVPVGVTRGGEAGLYAKRPIEVIATQVAVPTAVTLSGGRGLLHAEAGDWIVEHSHGEFAVVARDIFATTYDLLGPAD
jgi:hypothetical protein